MARRGGGVGGVPSAGPPGEELYKVGKCRVCGVPMFDDAPKAADLCNFCKKNEAMRRAVTRTVKAGGQHPHHKSPGRTLLEGVRKRHTDGRGIGSVKMPREAEDDLVATINQAIDTAAKEGAKRGKA